MGERLVLTIQDKEGNDIANAYYHWSGYTASAIQLTERAARSLKKTRGYGFTPLARAVLALRETGADFQNESELFAYLNTLPRDLRESEYENIGWDYTYVNRNDGVICVTEEEKRSTNSAGEEYAYIQLDDDEDDSRGGGNIDIESCFNLDTVDVYNENYLDWNEEWKPHEHCMKPSDELEQRDVPFNFTFNDMDDCFGTLDHTPEGTYYNTLVDAKTSDLVVFGYIY